MSLQALHAIVLRSPIGNRKLSIIGWSFAAAFAALLVPRLASAEMVTEADVIRWTRASDPTARAALHSVDLADAERVRRGTYPNPSVTWTRQHVTQGPEPERDDTFQVVVPIDFSSRRSSETSKARSDVFRARATASRTQSDSVVRALLIFYEALAAERALEIAMRREARLDEATRVLRRRTQEGMTAGYERLRLELEAEEARSMVRMRAAEAESARSRLRLWVRVESPTVTLRGTLEPAPQRDLPSRRVEDRPSLRFARSAAAEARSADSAAGFAWIPTFSLSGGLMVRQTTESHAGYAAGVALELPLFARGQDVRAESAAIQRVRAAELAMAERDAELDAVTARIAFVSARDELFRFRSTTGERLKRLLRAAESGYREGERTLLELLDAQRTQSAVELRELELALTGKRAEVVLRSARGEFE